jgi:UDP-glucuronate 4-epimerase
MEKVLVTGAAGFIGFYVCNRLLKLGLEVHGVDNINNYYDPKLKKSRLEILTNQKMPFSKIDLANNEKINELFHNFKPTVVINLAAQAGVRYLLENPHAYINSNIVGFLNILECCRNHSIEHLIYASSSSVYGLNKVFPFSEDHNVDHPVSLYAASKKSNEAMAHSYSHIFGLPSTGLRFFTVYGPWGRPDMALYIFTKKILAGEPIDVFGHGKMKRDFTYIDDIVEGIIRLIDN